MSVDDKSVRSDVAISARLPSVIVDFAMTTSPAQNCRADSASAFHGVVHMHVLDGAWLSI